MKHLKNRYLRSSKLSEAKFREIVKLFSADLTAVQIAQLANINYLELHSKREPTGVSR